MTHPVRGLSTLFLYFVHTFINLLLLLLLILIFPVAGFKNKDYLNFSDETLGASGLPIFLDYDSQNIFLKFQYSRMDNIIKHQKHNIR